MISKCLGCALMGCCMASKNNQIFDRFVLGIDFSNFLLRVF